MDRTTGKVINALTKGATDACSIGIDSMELPSSVKKFMHSMLNNVDDMVEEHLVLDKMKQSHDDRANEEAKSLEAPTVVRPDAPRHSETPEVEPVVDETPGSF